MIRLEIDHIVVTAADLDAGTAHVADALGVKPGEGGRHPSMATHNRLLALAEGAYLEVLAPDPSAAAPRRARFFGLDAPPETPRLSHWAARTDELAAALTEAAESAGQPEEMSRGDLSWRMALTPSGLWPFDGAAPALVEWKEAHPAASLSDSGCRLEELVIEHPGAARLLAEWPALGAIEGVRISTGPEPRLSARIDTPRGPRILA